MTTGPTRRRRRGEHGRAGAVAEERGGLAVVGVGVAREDVGADQQHGVGAAALDQRGALRDSPARKPVQARPTSQAIARSAPSAPATSGAAWADVVGRGGRDEHGVDAAGRPRRRRARGARLDREVGQALAGIAWRRCWMPVRFVIQARRRRCARRSARSRRRSRAVPAEAEDAGGAGRAARRAAGGARASGVRYAVGGLASLMQRGELGEHAAGAGVDVDLDAGRVQRLHRLAPAHGRVSARSSSARSR